MIERLSVFVLLTLPLTAFAYTVGPAPAGNPKVVATKEIKAAEHPCPKVKAANRNSDGSISAVCTNKEDYRIFTVDDKAIVMRCSAARKIGVSGC